MLVSLSLLECESPESKSNGNNKIMNESFAKCIHTTNFKKGKRKRKKIFTLLIPTSPQANLPPFAPASVGQFEEPLCQYQCWAYIPDSDALC